MKITNSEKTQIQTTLAAMLQGAEVSGILTQPQVELIENKLTKVFEKVHDTKSLGKCESKCIKLLKKQLIDKTIIKQVHGSFSAAKGMALAKRTLGFEIKDPNNTKGNFIQWLNTNKKDEKFGSKQVDKLTKKWEQIYDTSLGIINLKSISKWLESDKKSLDLSSKNIRHIEKAIGTIAKIDQGTQLPLVNRQNEQEPEVQPQVVETPNFEIPNSEILQGEQLPAFEVIELESGTVAEKLDAPRVEEEIQPQVETQPQIAQEVAIDIGSTPTDKQ